MTHATSSGRRRPQQPHREISRNGHDPEGGLFAVLQTLVALLVVCRLLTPAESAAEGDTLWLVGGWLAAGALWAWDAWRRSDTRVRFNMCDVAMGLLVVGHLVSAAAVLLAGGQRRAALNLAWEWVALGLSFFLLRQTLRSGSAVRRLLHVMVAAAVALACLGIWQHYVGLPATREEYFRITAKYEALRLGPPGPSAAEILDYQQRLAVIERWFADNQVPADPASRRRWEDRLKSTEPFAFFGLTNTLAGALVLWLVAAGGMLRRGRSSLPRFGIPLAACAVPLAYCLLLTKSRTAWLGLVAGLVAWGAIRLRHRFHEGESRSRRWTFVAAGGVAAAIAMLAVAALSGGFDKQVITEAPKSFRYRLEYWTGTTGVLREHPVFGTGPGNFRQHYLKHKLPGSSDEINDPHNLLLDVWANGGLLALVGLIVFPFAWAHAVRRGPEPDAQATMREPPATAVRDLEWPDASRPHPFVVGTAMAFVLLFLGKLAFGQSPDVRLPALLAVWLLALGALHVSRIEFKAPGAAAACGALALGVHLLGSGGIEMPAIAQMLLVAAALGMAPAAGEPGPWRRWPPTVIVCAGAAAFVVANGWLVSAGLPVLKSQSLLSLGAGERNPLRASRYFEQAAEADPLSPLPPRKLAGLWLAEWRRSPAAGRVEFERASDFQALAIEADPHNPYLYRELGVWHLLHYNVTGEESSAEQAVAALTRAVEGYPGQAAFRAELALALEAAGSLNEARAQAARALEFDELNRRAGHIDKFLPDELRQQLNALAGKSATEGDR